MKLKDIEDFKRAITYFSEKLNLDISWETFEINHEKRASCEAWFKSTDKYYLFVEKDLYEFSFSLTSPENYK